MIKPSHVKLTVITTLFNGFVFMVLQLFLKLVSNSTKYHPKLAFDQICDGLL